MDSFKIGTIMGLIILCMMIIGQIIGGSTGMLIGFAVGLALCFISYFTGATILLRKQNCSFLSEELEEQLGTHLKLLCEKATLPLPQLHMSPDAQPNAYTIGHDAQHAHIVLTQGLIEIATEEELKNMIALQIGTIQRGDMILNTYIATITGIISWWSTTPRLQKREQGKGIQGNSISILLRLITTPIIVAVLKWSIEPQRKYLEDFLGASMTREPKIMSTLFKKATHIIEQGIPLLQNNICMMHLYTFCPITNSEDRTLYQTHPDIVERINKLDGMTV